MVQRLHASLHCETWNGSAYMGAGQSLRPDPVPAAFGGNVNVRSQCPERICLPSLNQSDRGCGDAELSFAERIAARQRANAGTNRHRSGIVMNYGR